MGIQKPHDKEKPPGGVAQNGNPTQGSFGDAQNGTNSEFSDMDMTSGQSFMGDILVSTNVRNADSVINQGGFQNPHVKMGSFKRRPNQANSFGVESTRDPKMSVLQRAQYIVSKNDPKNTDKRSRTNSSATIPRDNQMHLPQGFQTAAEQTPNIAGHIFPEFAYAQLPGNTHLVARYQLVQILPSYGNMSPQSSNNFHTQAQQSSSAQVTLGHSKIPRGIGMEIAERSNIQPNTLFGISHAAQQYDLWGTQQTGNYQQHQAEVGHVQRPMPSSLIGPSHGSVPVQIGNIRPGAADNITGQGFPSAIPQSSNILGQPSLRRRLESPPVDSSKKIVGCGRSVPSPGRRYPPTPRPSSPALPPVVLQDSSQSLKPSGHKCMLCKRDVAFTPGDSPVSQPSNPPVVAVLPCGHVFHDECLQKITPKDQAKDPPCIPCALGGT